MPEQTTLTVPNTAIEFLKAGLKYFDAADKQQECLNYLLEARAMNPNLQGLNYALGCYCNRHSQNYKSYSFFKRELELYPDAPESLKENIYHLLGWAASNLGKCEEAVFYLSQAIKLNTNKHSYYNYGDLLYMTNHAYGFNDLQITDLANSSYENCFKEQFETEREIIKTKLKANEQLKHNKCRIGILSSYIHSQAAEVLLIDIFKNINRTKYDFYSYYINDVMDFEDDCTKEYRNLSQSFINIKNKTPLEIAELIIRDEIDILIDTLGHVKNNSLNVFSLKPAPIQISMVGYWGSTGLPQMDYLLVQKGWTKPEETINYHEKIIEVEHFHYRAKHQDINISEAPCLANDFITFGCFNRGQKINSKVLSIWSVILNLLPNSNLILNYLTLCEAEFREDMWIFFESQGISRTRIKLHGYVSTEAYFHLHNEIDIVLDPFPFSGGCTTVDALWMGVPVITKKGDGTAGRFSESFLNLCKVPELISENEEDYILKAIALGKDFNRIQNYKNTLRDKLIESKISDPKAAAKHFEQALEIIIELEQKKQKESQLPERIPQ
jgi:predicted O-linked N-acetylglucosamine transferase (SPINDLY family)